MPSRYLFALISISCALLFSFSKISMAETCYPDKGTPPLRICSFSCSSLYCGYNLPYLGKLHGGVFLSYYGKSDNKAIDIPSGADTASHYMRFYTPSDGTTLHLSVDEQPDFSLAVSVIDDHKNVVKSSEGQANEAYEVENLKAGNYIVQITKRTSSPGGRTANYVPLLYLLPTKQPDQAGNSRDNALNLGTLSDQNPTLSFHDNLQVVLARSPDGTPGTDYAIRDDKDWLRIDLTKKGTLRGRLRAVPILEKSSLEPAIYLSEGSALPYKIPDSGKLLDAGTHYIYVGIPDGPSVGAIEFGYSYQLDLGFQ